MFVELNSGFDHHKNSLFQLMQDIDNLMNTAAALSCIQMGYREDLVRRAIHLWKASSGMSTGVTTNV